jgi:pimeloyl-ACP methyl ester carboxylesterase
MNELRTTRISLPTGVTLYVQFGGPEEAEPVILLHGFPESHRTWRLVAPALARDFRVVAPDQRGFGRSDKPEGVDSYKTDHIVEDLIALADALDIGAFTLVGHDWGGAAAWLAALRHPDRVKRLVIVNAPHPLIFQKSLIDDIPQRAASQYIRMFRIPGFEKTIEAMGWETFFEKTFAAHTDLRLIPPAERQAYIEEWSQPGAMTAMLNWYRATDIVVPEVGDEASHPLWVHLPFPKLRMPVLVVWGLQDKALLPVQLEGLSDHVEDLRILTSPNAGHFVPWEQPELVAGAVADFMRES